MASKTVILFALIAAMICSSSTAQTSSCTKTLMTLSPCLNYVQGNSSSPSSSCCSQLSNVVSSQPQCLCLLLNGTASSYGFNINQTLALALPDVCSVQTPPVSRCDAGNSPSTANGPSTSPEADTPKENPPPTNIPSGSKSVDAKNGATNAEPSYGIAVFMLFIASSAYSVLMAGF